MLAEKKTAPRPRKAGRGTTLFALLLLLTTPRLRIHTNLAFDWVGPSPECQLSSNSSRIKQQRIKESIESRPLQS